MSSLNAPGLRHKTFISYHHGNDQAYRERFENMFVNQFQMHLSIGDESGH